jgi:hypothetical protein
MDQDKSVVVSVELDDAIVTLVENQEIVETKEERSLHLHKCEPFLYSKD